MNPTEIEILSAQIKKMREALSKVRFDSLNMDLADMEQIRAAYNLPDHSTAPLRERDARLFRVAAAVCKHKRLESYWPAYAEACYDLSEIFNEQAKELEEKNG